MFQKICQKTLANYHKNEETFPEIAKFLCNQIAEFYSLAFKRQDLFSILTNI